VLGPRGGGTTRRRASDAFRLGFAVVVVAVSIPVMRANSAVELSIVRVLHPPPAAISWLVTTVLAVVLAVGIAAAVIALVPRLRRLASGKVRPHLVNIWTNAKAIAAEPRKLVYVLAASTVAQLLIAFALGASLHAVGQRASLATLLTVITLAGIIGGAVPVPGGAGVVEAGLIAGLASAGIPQDQAVATVLIQPFFTAFLPPRLGLVHPGLDAPPRIRMSC
jgi:uncharacterized membrane protein YbhN (UPF0104 family)